MKARAGYPEHVTTVLPRENTRYGVETAVVRARAVPSALGARMYSRHPCAALRPRRRRVRSTTRLHAGVRPVTSASKSPARRAAKLRPLSDPLTSRGKTEKCIRPTRASSRPRSRCRRWHAIKCREIATREYARARALSLAIVSHAKLAALVSVCLSVRRHDSVAGSVGRSYVRTYVCTYGKSGREEAGVDENSRPNL